MPQILKAHESRKSWAAIQEMVRDTPAELNKLYTHVLDDIEEHERVESVHLSAMDMFSIQTNSLD